MKQLLIILLSLIVLVCVLFNTQAEIKTGAEKLVEDNFSTIDGLRVGLITNHTATVGEVHLADLIHSADNVTLSVLFAPEHGIRGEVMGRIEDEIDEQTGVPVYSLFGETRKPKPEMLENVDALLFDIQDVGTRFYTYISTMGYGMEAAAENDIKFIVLDRPNPLGGELVEGFGRAEGYESFVAHYPIPIVHGLTVGELALMAKGEGWVPGSDDLLLEVITLNGWERKMLWNDIGRDWNPPSPNIPDFDTAIIYPGTCFFEATETSLKTRGIVGNELETWEPFISIGAPWVDNEALANELNKRNLPGLRFEPVEFTPVGVLGRTARFEGEVCYGIRHIITDAESVIPVEAGIHVLQAFYEQAPKPQQDTFLQRARLSRLAGTDRLYIDIIKGKTPEEISVEWEDEVQEFIKLRENYLLYR